eukprot:2712373-Rhodomonas_salina.3
MGWAMPAKVLAAAKKILFGGWNWGGMAGGMAANAWESTEAGAGCMAVARGEGIERTETGFEGVNVKGACV